ncbi:hypothetical protein [Streptomyces sp. IBSBF 2435]|uniref:hypothetical protein n=1 Tax=Streptomyces sp. IBSBF 2435 TaxID=2903531 RepID=UPI002FDBCC61
MGMIRSGGVRVVVLAVVALALAGCGTRHAGDGAGGPGASVVTPGKPVDFPCPGESATPAPPPTTADSTVPPTDHYAENHGFMVPLPLHGQSRCDGLAAVDRVTSALEPLRRRGDFDPASALTALTALGYAPEKVGAYQNGPTGVSFLIDATPLCLEGTMDRDSTAADAFAGYPDHTGCDRPTGGH